MINQDGKPISCRKATKYDEIIVTDIIFKCSKYNSYEAAIVYAVVLVGLLVNPLVSFSQNMEVPVEKNNLIR